MAWEHDWAVHVGTERYNARLGSRDASHYDPERMEDNLRANIAGASAEMAAAKYLKRYWSGSYWPVSAHSTYMHAADVEPNYEVRRVREPNNPLPVRRNDVKSERTMVCAWPDPTNDYRSVYLIGYIEAQEGWDRGERAPYDRMDTRLVPQAFLTFYDYKLSKTIA